MAIYGKGWTDIKLCKKSDPVRLTDEHVRTIAEEVRVCETQVRGILHLINFKYGISDQNITVLHED